MQLRYITIAVVTILFSVVAIAAEVDDIQQLLKTKQFEEALTRTDILVRKNPKDSSIQFLRGIVLSQKGKIEESIDVFNKLIKENPKLAEPYNNLAVLYAKQNQLDKARLALVTAVKMNPAYPTAHENLGDLYARLASDAYQAALQLEDGNIAVKAKYRRVSGLNADTIKSNVITNTKVVEVAQNDIDNLIPHQQLVSYVQQQSEVIAVVEAWANTWSRKDIMAYLAIYSSDFKVPNGKNIDRWRKIRTERIERPKSIEVKISNLQVSVDREGVAKAKFQQSYRASHMADVTKKMLVLEKKNGRWLILEESTVN